MRIFTTLEESNRLKAAGYPQGKSEFVYTKLVGDTNSYINSPIHKKHSENCVGIDAPSAAEIMEVIWNMHCYLEIGFDDRIRVTATFDPEREYEVYGTDLLSTLVEAFCKMKGK